mmetsp:Transcript_605/g.2038  ORF Transcript_605/g.2038 Transcript_605/m.2038 type:complete len:244 (-) Transcript_605:537-1268(-)
MLRLLSTRGRLLLHYRRLATAAKAPSQMPAATAAKGGAAKEPERPVREKESAVSVKDGASLEAHAPKGMSLGLPSTSLGFTEERVGDEHDPKKWIKYGFKYAGAVVLFLIIFGNLKLYERQVMAEKERRRKEKEARSAPQSEAAQTATALTATDGSQAAVQEAPAFTLPQPSGPLFPKRDHENEEKLDPVDELLMEETSLTAKLERLRKNKRTKINDEKKAEVKEQLRQIEAELEALQRGQRP